MNRLRSALALVAAPALLLSGTALVSACTGITIRSQDGSVVFARTLEFASDIHSNLLVIPRAREFVGSTPDGSPGLRWKTRYASVGMNAFNLPVLVDGLNEKGLHVGIFYFPGYAGYQTINADERDHALAPQELSGFLLGTCASVDEAVVEAKRVRVGSVVLKEFGFVPPFHYTVSDASGASVVLEHVGGELKIHRNPLGVLTNAPTFDWHMTNLGNYVNLSVNDPAKLDLDGVEIPSFGQGAGLLGIPGDFTPPSRFVRAVAFSRAALPVPTAKEGILQAFHILNQFDIPKGIARNRDAADYTLWTIAADLRDHRYFFRTYDDSRIRMIDLNRLDLDSPDMTTVPIAGFERIEDVSESTER